MSKHIITWIALLDKNKLPNLKSHGQVIKYQETSTEGLQICVSQQYCWHMMIQAEWEDLRQKNSSCDIFTRFTHYFQLNFYETYFVCNQGQIKVIGSKYKPRHEKNLSESRFSITVLWVGIVSGVNGSVIILAKGKKLHPRIIGTKLVTRYVFPEGYCVTPNKATYTYDNT